MRHILLIANILLLTFLFGCADRDLYGADEDLGDGVGDIRLTASFENLTPAFESRAPGMAVHDINTLWVVLYRMQPDGTFAYHDHRQVPKENISQNGNSASPSYPDGPTGDYEQNAEGTTPRATFTLTDIPYGRYRIYAVANLSNLTRADCESEADLRGMTFNWDSDVAKNNKMFGYFTPADDQSAAGFQSPSPIVISRRSTDLHAWVKRMVSKVTVAFDPSLLYENVTVYIKKVTIRDIPKTCALGEYNRPSASDLESVGESIDYYTAATADDHEKWGVVLQKGGGMKGSVNHLNTDPALFFFENMQGDYEGEKDYLKEQIPEETGTSVDEPGPGNGADGTNDFKDRVTAGTWIEVEGFYNSSNPDKMSSGKIIYRFMLGKNITYNYDAERNYHYKLTLRLRGFANEADWHISYEEPSPTLYTPLSYNVSYLYGQYHGFPFRLWTGDDNVDQYVVKADITVNEWQPSTVGSRSYPAQIIGDYNDINGFAWNKAALDYVYKGETYAGFLSMRKPEEGDLEPNMKYGTEADAFLKNYYESKCIGFGAYTLEEGTRVVGKWQDNKYVAGTGDDGTYTVTHAKDGSATAIIPVYTRQRKLVTQTDFTGTNPYWAYNRNANIRFTVWTKNGEKVKFKYYKDPTQEIDYLDVPIYQVRRIENPTAIYRSSGSTEPFKVNLMTLASADATSYEPIYSTGGAWRASILVDPNGLVKLTGNGKEVTNATSNKYIEGSTGSLIEFTYEPRTTIGDGATRCAIILVEYHDYHCNHYIFVCQGYDEGVQLAGKKWSNYQVYATGQNSTSSNPQDLSSVNVAVTRNPLSIGSMYKRLQYNYGVREANNDTYGWLKKIEGNSISVSYLNGSTAAAKSWPWNSIGAYGWLNYQTPNTDKPTQGSTSVPSVTIADADKRFDRKWADTWTTVGHNAGKKLTVPTYDDFLALQQQCDFGFGIAYCDGATEPAVSRTAAYDFTDYNNTGAYDSGKKGHGMRVCVAYDKKTGNNILFPLGAIGQGRRARRAFYSPPTPAAGQQSQPSFPNPGSGSICYSGMAYLLYGTANEHRPLTYNVYRSPGAIYWVKQPKLTAKDLPDYASWDINYYTCMFNHYDYSSLGNWVQTNSTTGAGVPDYTSTKHTRADGTVYYTYTWPGTSEINATDALPIKLIYQ